MSKISIKELKQKIEEFDYIDQLPTEGIIEQFKNENYDLSVLNPMTFKKKIEDIKFMYQVLDKKYQRKDKNYGDVLDRILSHKEYKLFDIKKVDDWTIEYKEIDDFSYALITANKPFIMLWDNTYDMIKSYIFKTDDIDAEIHERFIREKHYVTADAYDKNAAEQNKMTEKIIERLNNGETLEDIFDDLNDKHKPKTKEIEKIVCKTCDDENCEFELDIVYKKQEDVIRVNKLGEIIDARMNDYGDLNIKDIYNEIQIKELSAYCTICDEKVNATVYFKDTEGSYEIKTGFIYAFQPEKRKDNKIDKIICEECQDEDVKFRIDAEVNGDSGIMIVNKYGVIKTEDGTYMPITIKDIIEQITINKIDLYCEECKKEVSAKIVFKDGKEIEDIQEAFDKAFKIEEK